VVIDKTVDGGIYGWRDVSKGCRSKTIRVGLKRAILVLYLEHIFVLLYFFYEIKLNVLKFTHD
jgi:hypothetical protein